MQKKVYVVVSVGFKARNQVIDGEFQSGSAAVTSRVSRLILEPDNEVAVRRGRTHISLVTLSVWACVPGVNPPATATEATAILHRRIFVIPALLCMGFH